MTIPNQELAAWAAYPSPGRSASAHAAIKASLLTDGRFKDHTLDVYIQGSYRNYVNTKKESDVDIVAELTTICEHDTRHLNSWQSRAFWNAMTYSDYSYQQFRSDVIALLTTRFKQAVVPHAKAIEVKGNFLRMKVDVLPAFRYRRVYTYDGTDASSVDGIAFWTNDNRLVVNWPKQHFENGVAKNDRCDGHFKPCVRMFKNARRVTVEHGLIADGLAPSYFLQGLLWNVPDQLFSSDNAGMYCGVLNWLQQNRWLYHQFYCQNAVDLLFGSSPEQWNLNDAFAVTNALTGLWNNW